MAGETALAAGEDEAVRVAPLVQFYISATSSLQERRPRTLKHDDTFGVFDHYGDIISAGGSPEGLFHRDMRYVSDLRVLINGRRPLLLSSTVLDNNALLTADMTNPDFVEGGTLLLAKNMIHIVRSKFLWNGHCHERFGIRNFDECGQRIELTIVFAADFADIFEVRGHPRVARGETELDVGPDAVSFTYRGLDHVTRRSVFRFDPPPKGLDGHHALFDLKLPPRGRASLFSTVCCEEGDERGGDCSPRHFFKCLRAARHGLRRSTSRAAAIETSNDIFNEVLCRSMADLYMLMTDTAHGPFPYAGIPWFSTAFGRDAIVTAIEMLWVDPAVARGVLKHLAALQATETRPDADAEPGKILHETRAGELARLGEVPFACYYGSVDSTPLFVMLAALYFERTGDIATVSQLWPQIERALAWIDGPGNRDGDGFLAYLRADDSGLSNQGWKDSVDSVFHADGAIARGAIKLCEVQGYVYAAKSQAARIASAMGLKGRATALMRESDELRSRFEETFWSDEIGTYALALDGQEEPCRVRSSNAGQLLLTGIASAGRARRVADQLMGRDFFSGWGIRTLASSEARYNPMSYHNGSVWPHDNALIGLGFARYGLKRQLLRLFSGMFDAASYMDQRRLPELFCGFRRAPGKGPTFYPVACAPQAWSSATPFALLQACLGLEFDCAAEVVRFREPRLPPFLDEVTIRSLTVGRSRMDILLRRYGTEVSVNVLSREGNAQVAVTL